MSLNILNLFSSPLSPTTAGERKYNEIHSSSPTAISRCKQHHDRNFKVTCILILFCGDVALNPGPNYKYPCGICSKPVKCNQKGISCETCDTWYHAKCSNIPDTEYLALSNSPDPWCCNDCILPDIDCFQDTAPPDVHTPGSRASTSSTRINSSTLGDSLLKTCL